MMSVFEGGDGCERAGRSERSRERPGEWRFVVEELEEDRESGGVDTSVAMVGGLEWKKDAIRWGLCCAVCEVNKEKAEEDIGGKESTIRCT